MGPGDEPVIPPPPGPPPQSPAPVSPVPVTTTAATGRRGPNPWLLLVIGLIVGLVVGLAGGYVAFNGRTVAVTSNPQASATPSASPSATPTAPATSSAAPVSAAPAPQGVVPCPVTTPAGQHPLDTPGSPGAGQHGDPSLNFCGGGNATIPTGTTRFMTGGSWGLGIADSCPQGSSGQGGMNTVLTVNELLPGGGQGPDSATEGGDWAYGSVSMTTGGNYQLSVTTVSPGCVWQINIYPS